MTAKEALNRPDIRPNNVGFKSFNATVRILEAVSAISKSSGKPMITCKVEVVEPEFIQCADGANYGVQGETFAHYFPLGATNRANGLNGFAASLAANIDDQLKELGLSDTDDITDTNPNNLVGKLAQAVIDPRPYTPKEKLTQEDIDAGRTPGNVKDEHGKDVVLFGMNIGKFVRAA